MDWTKKLAIMGIIILHKDANNLVLQTTKLMDTLFYVSSTNRWRIDSIQPDDYYKDWELVECNVLYYHKA